jgi:CysZ protein
VETGSIAQFFAGVRLLGRGLAMYSRNPRLLALGLIPAVITGLVFLAGFVALVFFIDDIAAAVTWFADDWSPDVRGSTRVVAGIGIVGLAALLGVLAFTAVTLMIGDPFYEKISERIEQRLGGVPDEVSVPWWRTLRRNLVDSARLLGVTMLIGIPLFCAGLIPGVGQTVVPVLGAGVGGWFLAIELVGVPFARRGLCLTQRRALLRANRSLTLGFGMAVFVCFLIPLGAVLVMPAAVAGGTLLARQVLGLSTVDGQPN